MFPITSSSPLSQNFLEGFPRLHGTDGPVIEEPLVVAKRIAEEDPGRLPLPPVPAPFGRMDDFPRGFWNVRRPESRQLVERVLAAGARAGGTAAGQEIRLGRPPRRGPEPRIGPDVRVHHNDAARPEGFAALGPSLHVVVAGSLSRHRSLTAR
jgi:hypothetical protein